MLRQVDFAHKPVLALLLIHDIPLRNIVEPLSLFTTSTTRIHVHTVHRKTCTHYSRLYKYCMNDVSQVFETLRRPSKQRPRPHKALQSIQSVFILGTFPPRGSVYCVVRLGSEWYFVTRQKSQSSPRIDCGAMCAMVALVQLRSFGRPEKMLGRLCQNNTPHHLPDHLIASIYDDIF